MSLKEKSEKLKELVSSYDSKWFLGDLSFVIHSGRDRAHDQLGQLSSPMRQLQYLAGLNISSDKVNGVDFVYRQDKWDEIVKLLNEIEEEYQKLLIEKNEEIDIEEWINVREVAIPSFLTYFNTGHLNYEEQIINTISDLHSEFDEFFKKELNLSVSDFLNFYENVDKLIQNNFQGHTTNHQLLRDNWEEYTSIESGVDENIPEVLKKSIPTDFLITSKFMLDKGMKDRFYPKELVSESLSISKVEKILSLLSVERRERKFLYYTESDPGNPIQDFPILKLENGMYQIFEIMLLLLAIQNFLEFEITKDNGRKDRYLKLKGDLLENRILLLFRKLFGEDASYYTSYYVEGNEQDILILWKDYAFIIEAKGYNLREPFRTPEKAFPRIRDDFNRSLGYGYKQTQRVEEKFLNEDFFSIRNSQGVTLAEIDTSKIKETFSLVVNIHSFGLVQNDLSYLLKIGEDSVYPWAVKIDDLEIFILTLIARNKTPNYLIRFLLFREELHGKINCSDELEICGGYLSKKINSKKVKYADSLNTRPDFGDVFDEQYRQGMGFKNEKYLHEKQSGHYRFW